VGLVEVYPEQGIAQKAYQIDGRIKLGFGRSGTRFRKSLRTVSAGQEYVYGNLRIIIHSHDFDSVDTAAAGVLRDDPMDATEIRLRHDLSGNGTTLTTYPGTTRKFFVVEVRELSIASALRVQRIDNGNVKGLWVNDDGKTHGVFRNLGTTAALLDLSQHFASDVSPTMPISLHSSRTGTPGAQPQAWSGTALTVPAHDQLLLIASNDATDHEASWDHFDHLLQQHPAISIVAQTPSAAACSNGAATAYEAIHSNVSPGYQLQWRVNDQAVPGATGPLFTPPLPVLGQRVQCSLHTTLANRSSVQLISNVLVHRC
jgi:hypothetical protein